MRLENLTSHLRMVVLAALTVAAIAASATLTSTDAGWLSRITKEASEAAGDATRRIDGDADGIARHVGKLPAGKGPETIGLIPVDGGHWTLVNKQGEVFTAASKAEFERGLRVLGPEAANGTAPLALLIGAKAALQARTRLDQLPASLRLSIKVGDRAVPLVKRRLAGRTQWVAAVHPNVLIPLGNGNAFEEAIWQISRRIEPSAIRVIALTDAPAAALPRVARHRTGSRALAAEAISATNLAEALPALRGQTAVLSGRVSGDVLTYRTARGVEKTLDLAPIRAAARDHDINLVILQSSTPRQPGSLNWLWQRTEVDGLSDALRRTSVGEFLDAVAKSNAPLVVTAGNSKSGRTMLKAEPFQGLTSSGVGGVVDTTVAEIFSETIGTVIARGMQADLVSSERQKELDLRLVPGVPSSFQFGYLAAVVMGLIGLVPARSWWFKLWPPERRADYGGAFGYQTARAVRLGVFALVFLPLVGFPAFVSAIALKIWWWITLPFRFMATILR